MALPGGFRLSDVHKNVENNVVSEIKIFQIKQNELKWFFVLLCLATQIARFLYFQKELTDLSDFW